MLISPEYQAQQRQLHEDNDGYGVASVTYAPLVSQICNKLQVEHLLDYGCGKGRLFASLAVDHPMTLQAYDPGMEKYAALPVPAQMVACIDVLEHVEPVHLDDVLDDLKRLTEVIGFFTIHTGPAKKTLPDGRNAHLTQEPLEWWLPKLWERFDLHTVQRTDEFTFYAICYARGIL